MSLTCSKMDAGTRRWAFAVGPAKYQRQTQKKISLPVPSATWEK